MNYQNFREQEERWPRSGRHIMAQYDETSIVVYQAYREAIGNYAVQHQQFGGEFSYSRMSWIKPNFLWMMFRSGWGSKERQEVVLAIRIHRNVFNRFLENAIHSSFRRDLYGTNEEWKRRVQESDVRLQWDPDHSPTGEKLERRAIQLGLRGEALRTFGKEAILEIQDVSEFVREQGALVARGALDQIEVPVEHPYPAPSEAVRAHLGIDTAPTSPTT